MNAGKAKPPTSPNLTSFRGLKPWLIASFVFHLLFAIALTVGIPFFPDEPIDINPPVNIEIVDIADVAQTNNPAPPQKSKPDEPKTEPKPPEPEKKTVPEMKAEAPPDLTQPKPPEVEDLPKPEEDLPTPDPVKKPKKKPDPPKKEVKKPEPTKVATQPKQQDQFASLLKNLAAQEISSGADPAAAQQSKTNPDVAQLAELANRLTITEQDALKRQLAQCWVVLAGAKYAEDLSVELRVYMNADRTVQSVDVLDKLRYSSDTHYRAAADAAQRALRNPRCTPLELPPDKYHEWKVFVVRFDPSEML